MKRISLISAFFTLTLATAAHADFAKELEAKFPGAVGAKVEPAFPGFYSVVRGGEVIFVKDDLSIMINGDVVDLANGTSITNQLKQANKPRVDVSKFDTQNAITFGTGSHKLYVFSDPDCPYCRQLEGELDKLEDTTVFIFPFPLENLHPQAYATAESIWCAKDRAQAWKNYLLREDRPAPANCNNPIKQNLVLGQSIQIQGTPALIFQDGTVIPGAVPVGRIKAQFALSESTQK